MQTFAQMGLGSVVQGVSGLVRAKLVAATLGTVGVGLYGLLFSLMQTLVMVGGLGQDLAGPRRIAQAQGEEDAGALARSIWAVALLLGLLAVVAGAVLWVFHGQVAVLLGVPEAGAEIAWLSLAVALGIAAFVPVAILQGLRRIDSLALVNVWAGGASLVLGGAAILLLGRAGIVVTMIVTPACLLLAGLWAAVAALQGRALAWPLGVGAAMVDLARRGAPFMVAGGLVIGSTLAARGTIQQMLGPHDLGLYAAATTLGMTYLPLLLGALGADYLPRLAAIVHRPDAAVRLVADQTEVALLIILPMAIGIIALAPWLMVVLFSAEFRPAAPILQWLVFADILRVAVWPLGYVLLARGEGWLLIGVDLCVQGVFLALTTILAGQYGVVATAAAYPVAAVIFAGLSFYVVRRRLPVRLERHVLWLLASGLALAGMVAWLSGWNAWAGAGFGGVVAAGCGAFGLVRLVRLTGAGGVMRVLAERFGVALRRVGIRV